MSGIGFLSLVVLRVVDGRMPTGFGLSFGVLLIVGALVLGVRRLSFDRRLVFNKDGVTLPRGFLQIGTARIAYPSIRRVWRHYLPFAVVLRVATDEHTFEIVSGLLPDNKTFLVVEEFLNLKAQENAAAGRAVGNSQSK
jgi:hypothetical protein